MYKGVPMIAPTRVNAGPAGDVAICAALLLDPEFRGELFRRVGKHIELIE